jgi:hypothetical protein
MVHLWPPQPPRCRPRSFIWIRTVQRFPPLSTQVILQRISLGLFEMLQPGALSALIPPCLFWSMAAIPLSPRSCSASQSRLSLSRVGLSVQGRILTHSTETHCYRRVLFSEVARDPSANLSHTAPTALGYFDKPHQQWCRKVKRRKVPVIQASTVNAEPMTHPMIGAAINSGVQ